MPAKEDIIAALIRERAGYEAQGNEEGVAAVDAELRAFGHKAAAPAKRAEIRPAEAPEKRGPGRPKKAEA